MYMNRKIDWKPTAEYYTHKSGYIKNVRYNNSPQFKPRPIIHYRKQYPSSNTISGKYLGNYLGMYSIPGGNILSIKPSSDICIGVSGIADHRLNYKEINTCYTNKNCNKIKRSSIKPVSKNYN